MIKAGNKTIGNDRKTFVVAEIGINHNGDIEIAKDLISAAAKSGADAVKFQTYKTEKRVKKESPIYGILKKCELTEDDTKELMNIAKKKDIIFFSTPFDEESVDLLSSLKVPLFKVASFDIVNKNLLKKIAITDIPVIISRGMANKNELDEALKIFHHDNIAILHCISAYPTKTNDANLNVIRELKNNYHYPIGYSDHTIGIEVPVLSVAVGACIVEKHFTLDKNLDGPDHKISADIKDLIQMILQIRRVEGILGKHKIQVTDAEKGTLMYRRYS